MKEHESAASLPPARAQAISNEYSTLNSSRIPRHSHGPAENPPALRPEQIWFLVDILRRRWFWLILGTTLIGVAGYFVGQKKWKPSFTASARIVRKDSPSTAQIFAYQTITAQTMSGLLKSPELFARVAELAQPPLTPIQFAKRLRLSPENDGEVVLVEATGPSREAAADLANLYTREAVAFTQRLQAHSAEEVKKFIEPQLADVEGQIAALAKPGTTVETNAPVAQPTPAPAPSYPTVIEIRLQAAREELAETQARYTDSHPAVQMAKNKVATLERLVAEQKVTPYVPTEAEVANRLGVQHEARETLRGQLAPLEATRRDLIWRTEAADLVITNPPGYYRAYSPADPLEAKSSNWKVKIVAGAVLSGVIGFALLSGLAILIELLDRRLKNPADVTRVTGLPILATAPDVSDMNPTNRSNWAFRTWMTLQGRLSPASNEGLVCGITSAAHGEGRSTWIKHLARAASDSGFRVVTVIAQHPPSADDKSAAPAPPTHPNGANNHTIPVDGNNSLPTLSEVEHTLVGPDSQPVMQIQLPGWVWNLDRRREWQSALQEWQRISSLVILIELPPASVPETILLAQELPNLIWLSDSGRSEAAETVALVEALRNARCRLVGAVLNRAPIQGFRNRFARWRSPVPA